MLSRRSLFRTIGSAFALAIGAPSSASAAAPGLTSPINQRRITMPIFIEGGLMNIREADLMYNGVNVRRLPDGQEIATGWSWVEDSPLEAIGV